MPLIPFLQSTSGEGVRNFTVFQAVTVFGQVNDVFQAVTPLQQANDVFPAQNALAD